ncbi:MAG: cytidylyltransferase domain-containing protein [Flavobacteriales bacterium]
MSLEKKIVVISQARMTSTRLPGKVLMNVDGQSLLKYHLDRLQSSLWQLVVATTTNASDDSIVAWCKQNDIATFRGSEDNVLERFYEAARSCNAEIIVRVTSDCPLIDKELIEQGLNFFETPQSKNVYVSNCFPRTFARGFDFEIFSFEALEEAYLNAHEPFDLEHATPYIWKNKSGRINLQNITQAADNSSLRLCVDTREDFLLIQKLIEQYKCDKLSYQEIESLLNSHLELKQINANIEQKKL